MKLSFFAFLFFMLFSTTLNALDVSKGSVFRDFPMHYLEGEYSFEVVKEAKEWKRLETSNFAFGYTHGNYWFKLDFNNSSSRSVELLLEFSEPFADSIIFYVEDEDSLSVFPSGLANIKEAMDDRYFLPTMPLEFQPNSAKTVYVNYSSKFTSYGSFALYDNDSIYLKNMIRTALFFFYFGAIAIMVAYNFFIYFSLRDKSYIYYVGYSLIFGLWILLYSGYAIYFFGGETIYSLHASTPLAFFFFTLFSRYVLNIDRLSQKLKVIFNIFAILLLLFSVIILIDLKVGYFLTNLLGVFYFPFVIYAAIYALTKGVKIARLYILALGIYLLFMNFVSLLAMGLIEFSYFSKFSFIFGSLIEILLFSFLLAYRINEMKSMQISTSKELAELKRNEADKLKVDIAKSLDDLSISNNRLKKALSEKEFLLKEVYHRVKNNLQTITSILWLKSNKIESSEAKAILNDVSYRIQSMSLVHELLYDSKNLNEISSSEYITKLTDSIISSISAQDIKIIKTIDDIALDTDTAISIGIIVVEIVTNSIKHAFKNTDSSLIFVNLTFINYVMKIEISDDGECDNIDYNKNSTSLGLKLVKQMIKKLTEAKYSITYDGGTKFYMEFVYVPPT